MEKKKLEEVIKGVIQKRINLLASIIANEADDENEVALSASIQLANIGTKESSNALMYLINRTKGRETKEIMTQTLLLFSPFRSEYSEAVDILSATGPGVEEIQALVALANEQGERFGPPLWQEVAEALEAELADRRHGPELFRG